MRFFSPSLHRVFFLNTRLIRLESDGEKKVNSTAIYYCIERESIEFFCCQQLFSSWIVTMKLHWIPCHQVEQAKNLAEFINNKKNDGKEFDTWDILIFLRFFVVVRLLFRLLCHCYTHTHRYPIVQTSLSFDKTSTTNEWLSVPTLVMAKHVQMTCINVVQFTSLLWKYRLISSTAFFTHSLFALTLYHFHLIHSVSISRFGLCFCFQVQSLE